MRTSFLLLSFPLFVMAAGCGGDPKPDPATGANATPAAATNGTASSAPASSAATDMPAPATPAPPGGGDAHRLAMLTAGCWFGGVWSDAEGDTSDTRAAAATARCNDLVRRVWGTEDKTHFEQIRAFDQNAVDDVAAKIDTMAKGDVVDAAHRDALGKLFRAVAVEKKEEMEARRAASRVKRDLDREPERLSADEAASVGALKTTAALEALLKLDAGDLTTDAHALGVMSAMDRMEIARGLPKHLKVYAVSGAYTLLFGIPAPAVPDDAKKALKPGLWLGYLSDTSKAAGHPVPDTAKTPKDREPLAWAGVLEGFGDKLKADCEKISDNTPLREVAARVARRLDTEYNATSAALASRLTSAALASRLASPAPAAAPSAAAPSAAAPLAPSAKKK